MRTPGQTEKSLKVKLRSKYHLTELNSNQKIKDKFIVDMKINFENLDKNYNYRRTIHKNERLCL